MLIPGYGYGYIPQGWQCPVCGKVNAPYVGQCLCNLNYTVTYTGTTPTLIAPELKEEDQSKHLLMKQLEEIKFGHEGENEDSSDVESIRVCKTCGKDYHNECNCGNPWW